MKRDMASKFSVLSFILIAFGLQLDAQCNFKTIGHRGGSSYYYPENTLISLEQGFIEDIYAAEVDVRFTSDNVLVLMHDSYIDRTTNGLGFVNSYSLSDLKKLDAGSWKNPKYKGTPVPTLKEALLLANKYNKKLYLNMKVYAPELIAKTLKEANVPDDMVIIDPDDLDKVKEYHRLMPNTPLAYFGELPENIEDPAFYSVLKNNGVIAIEIPADYIRFATDDTYIKLKETAHSYNLELWAYTVNDPAYFKLLNDFGIDGLETDRPSEAHQYFCENSGGGYFPEKRITGQWDFNNNLSGTIGSQLAVIGDPLVSDQKVQFGTTKSFGLPSIEGKEVNIARIPAFDANHDLRFFSNIAPEGLPGALNCDDTYTLIFDILKPYGINSYTAIFQTSNSNADDADYFIYGKYNKIGVLENYSGGFNDSTWIRLVLVFDLFNEKLDQYVDGEYVATVSIPYKVDGRFCINNNWGVQSSNFFSDDSGETNPMFVSSIQLRNYSLSSDEIKYLGKPKAQKIDNIILSDPDEPCPEFESNIVDPVAGEPVILEVDAVDEVNYRWEMNKGAGWENIAGAELRIYPPNKLNIIGNPGLYKGYKFRCMAMNDCITVSNEYTLKDYTGLEQLSDVQSGIFTLYPNPSKGNVNIQFAQSGQYYDLTVYSILGIEIYAQRSASNLLSINLQKGSYLVRVNNGSVSETRKLIVVD